MRDPGFTSVFLSHSSKDVRYAAACVRLLNQAIEVDDDEILCTSVPGHCLPPGVNYEIEIREAICGASYFIALLSPNSVASFFFAIECGVAWSEPERPLAAICLPGFTPQEVPRPLQTLQVLRWQNKDDWIHLLGDVADNTGSEPQSVNRWNQYVNDMLHV